VRTLRGHQGLARAGRHHDLRAQPTPRDGTGRRHLKGGPYGVDSLTLVRAELRHQQSFAVPGDEGGQTCSDTALWSMVKGGDSA
jgi:hypothetical protein